MARSDRKVVQTELSESEYRRLRQLADEEDISLKEALRRATDAYLEVKDRPDPEDPFFTFHDRVDTEAATGEETDARNMDEDLYGEDA
jgi:hypothetical protein